MNLAYPQARDGGAFGKATWLTECEPVATRFFLLILPLYLLVRNEQASEISRVLRTFPGLPDGPSAR